MNFGDILGSLMQGGMGQAGQQRLDNALGNSGIGDILTNVLGGMGDTLGRAGTQVRDNPMAAGGLGAILGSLLGGGSGAFKGALGGGALAVIASIAMQALGGKIPGLGGGAEQAQLPEDLPLGLRPAREESDVQATEDKAQLLIKAMISAAKADGQVDQQEMERIMGKMREAGANSEIQTWMLREFSAPLDINALVRAIPDQATAAEVYAASLFAIDLDTDAERNYLSRLASMTGLDGQVVGRIHAALGVR